VTGVKRPQLVSFYILLVTTQLGSISGLSRVVVVSYGRVSLSKILGNSIGITLLLCNLDKVTTIFVSLLGV